MASAFMLCLTYTSCDELPEEEDIEEQKQNQNQNQNNDLKGLVAYLPTDYAQKNLAAWYMLTDVKTEKSKVEAVFLFEDSTFVMTIATYYPESANQNPEYIIDATGIYVLAEGGDFDNGKASVIPAKGDPFEVEIKDGKLYAKDEIFTRMTDKLLFSVIDVNNGGDNGNKDVNDVLKYLEARYGNKTVTAYYVCVDAAPGEIRSEAIFLFDDDSMAIAELKVFPEDTEAHPGEFYIHQVGTYELTQGDYTNGVLKLMPKDQNPIVVEIQNGVLHLYNQDYYKDGIIKNNGGDGDDNGGDGDDNGGDGDDNGGDGDDASGGGADGGDDSGTVQYNGDAVAYLPVDYADKTIAAWYTYTDKQSQSIKILAVFLFTDKTLVVTKSKVYSTADGRPAEYGIEASGTYEMVGRSDYTQGTANVTTNKGEFEVNMNNGVLTSQAFEETFTMQDKDKAPTPMKL